MKETTRGMQTAVCWSNMVKRQERQEGRAAYSSQIAVVKATVSCARRIKFVILTESRRRKSKILVVARLCIAVSKGTRFVAVLNGQIVTSCETGKRRLIAKRTCV